MKLAERASRLMDALDAGAFAEREVFVKTGRSRRVEVGPAGEVDVRSEEDGWAVRASTDRAAFLVAGSGEPPSGLVWPDPDGRPLRLPRPTDRGPWRASADLDIPLLVEGEAKSLIRAIQKRLSEELPGAGVAEAVLEDGESSSLVVNHHGVEAETRGRAAALRILALGPGERSTHLYLAERAARRFQPARISGWLASLLAAQATGRAVERDRGEFVLAPGLASRLLAALRPLWLGRDASSIVASLRDRTGRLTAPGVTIVDNPRHEGLVPGVAWDGEGVPTRETVIVQEGRFQQPLLSWREADPPKWLSSGCTQRASWRDRPAPGITQLYIRPDRDQRAAELLQGITRGYYLMDEGRSARVDVHEDRFVIPVCGYRLEKGRAREAVSDSVLTGGVRSLLQGIQAVAADLEFFPLGGLVGSPSLLATGLELRKA